MEAGRNLISTPPSFHSRTYSLNPSSSSVMMQHEQAGLAVTSVLTSSVARHFPTSVLLQEQREEYRSLVHMFKEEKAFQATIDRRQIEESGISGLDDKSSDDKDQLVKDFEHQLVHWPGLWNLLPSKLNRENSSLASAKQSMLNDSDYLIDVELLNTVSLAKKALSASKEAASLVVNPEVDEPDLDETFSASTSNLPPDKVKTVRSTRLLDRRSKKRRVSKLNVTDYEKKTSSKVDVQKKLKQGFDPNDALRLFLRGPETRTLLTTSEECELIAQVQDLMKLEKVKSELQSQFGREPTLVEWAEVAGISCRDLHSEIHAGNSSRDKLINSNLRLVVHVAKKFQGRGLNLQDLLQEGSKGLMKSVEKFKPHAGSRFSTYAYWWIRQMIRKALFKHSRTIRLPENVYLLQAKVLEAKRLYIQEGNHNPTKEELAGRVGITVLKLERLLYMTRMPLSIQQPVWSDQETTFQEITADTRIETPVLGVSKKLMRQHVHNLLSILSPRERRIIKLRYGILDGKPRSLSEIGELYGLSKERVRQLESRALYRLKQSLGSQAVDGYADLLI